MVRRQRWIGLLILAALLLSACQPIVAQPQAAAQPSDEDVTAAVNAVWEEYEASIEAGDADRWGELWVDDGVKFPPDAPVLDGKDAIVGDMRAWLEVATANDVAISNQDVQVAGDLALSRGLFRVDAALKDGGMPLVMDGKYMSVLQRQPDGSWKLYRDTFNSNAPSPAPPAPEEADVEAVTEAVLAIWDEYEASILAGDPDRWIALWAEDGVQLPPGNPPVVGKAAIYDRISADLAAFEYSEFIINNEDVEVNGDLAFARGNYVVTLAAKTGGDPISVDGKYMTIMRQQPDGSWKIYRDIFNSNVPPAPAEEADKEAVTEAVLANWDEYEASILAGDPDRWIALWAEDGVQLPPGNPPVVGKAAIYDRISADLAAFEYSEFVINNEDVEVNGDLAFARGNYVVTLAAKAGGDPISVDGKYMTIMRQQPDGSWKIYRDIFNSNVP